MSKREDRTPPALPAFMLAVGLVAIGWDCEGRQGGDGDIRDDSPEQEVPPGPECSPCRAMSAEECWQDLRCESIPCWALIDPVYDLDHRGFSWRPWWLTPDGAEPTEPELGPGHWVGCRTAGMHEVCPCSSELAVSCPYFDDEGRIVTGEFGIDPRGCRTCQRDALLDPDGRRLIDPVPECARHAW